MATRADETRITQALDLIYEAAFDSTRWRDSVQNICDLFHASRTCFAKFDPVTRAFEHVSTEADPEAVRQLKQFDDNVMLEAACSAPLGEIYSDRARIGVEQLKRSAFWNDWARPRDMFGSLTTKIYVDGASFWFLDLQRGKNSEAFDAQDAEMLGKVAPHILRAGRISRTFQAKQSVGQLFHSLPFGLFVVDRERNVLASNEVAAAILAERGSGLQLRANRLVVASKQDDDRLAALIGKTCQLKPDGLRDCDGDLMISALDANGEKRSFVLSVGPLSSTTMFGTSFQSCSAIFVKEARMMLPVQFGAYLQANFELTPAEARVVMALANGQSLKEIAAISGLQLKTARSYLESIFHKTETHQQSQLVALLRGSAPYGMS